MLSLRLRPLSEQVLVVLGASSGIGRATALAAAARGARVVAAARGTEALDSLVAEVEAAGGTAVAVPTDATDPAAVQALADAAEQRFGRVDTWANVVGVSVYGRVEQVTAAEFEQVLRINVLSHVHGVHAALPALRRAGRGAVVGVSSMLGVRAVPLQAPYVASKFALRGFYDSLRIELAEAGEPIGVTTVLPVGIDTPFFEHARSKTGFLPKPPPPVYAPELVADAILAAAVKPSREVPVGGAAAGVLLGQVLSPALTDAVLSVVGTSVQDTGEPADGTDILDRPAPGPGAVRGSRSGRTLEHSPFTAAVSRVTSVGEALTGALTAARRNLRRPAPGGSGRDRGARAEGDPRG